METRGSFLRLCRVKWKRISWQHLIILPIILTLSSFLYRWQYGLGVFLSFYNGENAVLFWIREVGMAPHKAVYIAIAASTYDIFCWFTLFSRGLEGVEGKVRHYLSQIAEVKRWIASLETGKSWVAKVYRWFKKKGMLYLAMPFCGFLPGFIFVGVPLSIECRLNLPLAFLLVALGNTLKMLAARYAVLKMGVYSTLAAIAAIILIEKLAKFFIRKWHNGINALKQQ